MKRSGGERFLGIPAIYHRIKAGLKERVTRRGNIPSELQQSLPAQNPLKEMKLGGCYITPDTEPPPPWFDGTVPDADFATIMIPPDTKVELHPRLIKPDEDRELKQGMKRIPVFLTVENQSFEPPTLDKLQQPDAYIDIPDPKAHEVAREQWKRRHS